MVFVIWLGVALVSAVAATLALYVSFPGSTLLTNSFGDRTQGLFKDPNVYGPFLVPVAVLVLHELLEPRLLRIGRTLKLLALGILVLGVTVAYSRAAWLNLAVAVAVMLAVMPLRRGGTARAGALLLTILVCVAAAAGTVLLTGSSSFFEERAHLQSYDSQRFGAQRAASRCPRAIPSGSARGSSRSPHPSPRTAPMSGRWPKRGVLGLIAIGSLLLGTLIVAAAERRPRRGTRGPRARRPAGRLVRAAGQQRLRRHVALAAPVDPRRPDLGRLADPARADAAQASSSAGCLRPT